MTDEPVPPGDGMLVAVPAPTDAQLDVLIHVCEIILAWPCPECGQTGPCACDTHLAERLRASGCNESDICAILPVQKRTGHTGACNTYAALVTTPG